MRNNLDLDVTMFTAITYGRKRLARGKIVLGTKHICIYTLAYKYIICTYRYSTSSPEAVTLIAVFSNSKELLPVPSVGTHWARRRTYVRVWSTMEGRAGQEQEGEGGAEVQLRGKRERETAASEKGSHSGQLITRELTRRFQYHLFHLQH